MTKKLKILTEEEFEKGLLQDISENQEKIDELTRKNTEFNKILSKIKAHAYKPLEFRKYLSNKGNGNYEIL